MDYRLFIRMRFSEKMLIFLGFAGFVLKGFFFEPAGDTLLALSLLALSIVYVLFGWRIFKAELNRAERQPQFVFSVFSSFGLALGVLALTFKFFSWQKSGWVLGAALLGFVILLLLFRMQRLDYMAHRNIGIRLTIATVCCFVALIIPNHTVIRFFYRFDPVLTDLHIKVYDHPKDEQFRMEFLQYKRDLIQKQIREDRNEKIRQEKLDAR